MNPQLLIKMITVFVAFCVYRQVDKFGFYICFSKYRPCQSTQLIMVTLDDARQMLFCVARLKGFTLQYRFVFLLFEDSEPQVYLDMIS